jgi:hypothetical protein
MIKIIGKESLVERKVQDLNQAQLKDVWYKLVMLYASKPKDDYVNKGVEIAKEIVKRKLSNGMKFTVSQEKGKSYRDYWQKVRSKLTLEERAILTEVEKKTP